MLAILAFLLALGGGAFASPFHGVSAHAGVVPPARMPLDGTSGNPDHPVPPPPPGPSSTPGKIVKIGGPVLNDGTSGNPDHP